MISFYKKILKYIALISPQTVIVERNLIVARKTEYACGNSMHLLIEFLLESQASLNKRPVQLLAWLRIFVVVELHFMHFRYREKVTAIQKSN